jgi:hypothetical protein
LALALAAQGRAILHVVSDLHATISAFDLLDQVVITALVFDLDEERGPRRLVYELRVCQPGVGRSDPKEWLSDQLALLQLELGRA